MNYLKENTMSEQLDKIRESLQKANEFLQNSWKKQLAELEEKYKDVDPLPQEAINQIGQLKDKIKK